MKIKYILLIMVLARLNICYSQSLKVGDPAPTLKLGKWVKGQTISEYHKDNIYVLEFWATWCVPCKDVIPHISWLSEKYKDDIKFIGINVWESDTKLVETFVEKNLGKIGYSIAIDLQEDETSRKGYMTANYLGPLGIKAIPTTIVIGKTGLIEWIGHPMNLESVLQNLKRNTWDAKAYGKNLDKDKSLDSLRSTLGNIPDWITLSNKIRQEFPMLSADSIILSWKYPFYLRQKEYQNYTHTLINYVEKYDPRVNPELMNSYAWDIFSLSSDSNELRVAAAWLQIESARSSPLILDTYANILHKLGRKSDALAAQKKAINFLQGGPFLTNLAVTYYKILTDQPTWIKGSYTNRTGSWKRVRKAILQSSGNKSDSLLFMTKVSYMKDMQQWEDLTDEIIQFSNRKSSSFDGNLLNNNAWYLFNYRHDSPALVLALNLSKKSLTDIRFKSSRYTFLETYSNILYKVGKISEAIRIMEEAIKLAPSSYKPSFVKTLDKMNNGERTWSK